MRISSSNTTTDLCIHVYFISRVVWLCVWVYVSCLGGDTTLSSQNHISHRYRNNFMPNQKLGNTNIFLIIFRNFSWREWINDENKKKNIASELLVLINGWEMILKVECLPDKSKTKFGEAFGNWIKKTDLKKNPIEMKFLFFFYGFKIIVKKVNKKKTVFLHGKSTEIHLITKNRI